MGVQANPRRSEEKGLSCVFWISQVLLRPSGNGQKVTPPFAAAQFAAQEFVRKKLYIPPPLHGPLTSRHFLRTGKGLYCEAPPVAEFYTPPVYTPTPRRLFSGEGVYKIWPPPICQFRSLALPNGNGKMLPRQALVHRSKPSIDQRESEDTQ